MATNLMMTLPASEAEQRTGVGKAQVFVVEDHPMVRRGLQLLINRERDLVVCGEAEGADEALRRITELQPDLAVVDLTLKQGSGMELIPQLREVCPALKILVFSMHDEAFRRAKAMEAGANAFVPKDEGPEKVVRTLHELLGVR